MPEHAHHRSSRREDCDPREFLLLKLVDLGSAGVVFVLPICMGGRHAVGQFLLVALATLIGTAWAAKQAVAREGRWRTSGGQWLLAAVTLLVSVQLMRLPENWLTRLSPELPQLLPLWMSSAGDMRLGAWNQLSLTPGATREALVQWLAYAILFLATVQRVSKAAHIERLLRWIAWSAAGMACFGLVQYLAANGKFFWVYEHPFIQTTDCVRGAFTNRNHFAHFLALGSGPLLFWVQSTWQRERTGGVLRAGLAMLLLAIVLFAALMSFSRGGAVAIAVAVVSYFAVAWWTRQLSSRFAWTIGSLSLLVLAMLLVHGYQSVATRLDDLATGSFDQLDQFEGRRKVWSAVCGAIADFPLLGSGVGSHREIYHRYFDGPSLTEYTHAESGYLQVAEETGLLGLMLLISGLAMCAYWCGSALRHSGVSLREDSHGSGRCALLAPIVASLTASAVHSIYDFVWYVPSCAAHVALLAGCAFHLRRWACVEPLPSSRPAPRWLWVTACCLIALAGIAACASRWGAIPAEIQRDRYLIASRGFADPQASADLMLANLSKMVDQQPDSARMHLAMAEACLRQFDLAQRMSDNPMSLTSVRDVALSGQFAGRPELHTWLDRALGPRRVWLDRALWHTQRSLALCPLQGQGYLYLAELSFLNQTDRRATRALIDQSLAVRPNDGGVLFKAAEEAALTGDRLQAIGYWKQAMRCGPSYQAQLIAYLADRKFPLSFFVEYLDPDLDALGLLQGRYRGIALPQEYQPFLQKYVEMSARHAQTARGAKSVELWLQAHRLAVELEDQACAGQYAEQALAADPANFSVRLAVAEYLLAQKRPAEAEQHVKWCLARKPNDPHLRAALEAATKGRIDAQTQVASRGIKRS